MVEFDTDEPFVYLVPKVCENGPVRIKTSIRVLCVSEMMKEELEDEEGGVDIPFMYGNKRTIMKMLTYCQKHLREKRRLPKSPITSSHLHEFVDTWDEQFININKSEVMDLMVLANYLRIELLVQLCAACLAAAIYGKTPEEAEEMFKAS